MQRILMALLVLILSSTALLSKGSLAPALSSRSCSEVAFTQRPGWVMAGAWTADGSELALIDSLSQAVLRYSDTGDSMGPIGEPLQSTLKNFRPSTGRLARSGLILQVGNDLLVLDKSYRPVSGPVSTLVAASTKAAKGLRLGGLHQWEPVGTDIVAFGDVQGPGPDQWMGAVIRFPLSNPAGFTILKEIPRYDDERVFFRTAFPYIAAIGDTAYVLSMGNTPALYKNTPHSDELEPMNAFLQDRTFNPIINSLKTPSDFVLLMSTIEKATMPVGLYAWKGSLYILARSPQQDGTRWTLSSIDPVHGKYTGTVVLPTKANHLTVVPGPKKWAFIEKGPVQGYGIQRIPKVLLIPEEQLRAPLRRRMLCQSLIVR